MDGRSVSGLHPHWLTEDLASPCTAQPTADWTSQHARNFALHVDEHDPPCNRVMRDNDKQHPKTFDTLFTTPICQVKWNVPDSPNLQAHVERLAQTLKHEGNAPSGTHHARYSPEPVTCPRTSQGPENGCTFQ